MRANVPGLSAPSAFGTCASNAKARVAVSTAGLMRDMVPLMVLPGKASTLSSTGCPLCTHGAIRSGISPVALSESMRTMLITGAWLLTKSPIDTSRFWT